MKIAFSDAIMKFFRPVRGVSRHQNVLKFKNVWIWSERGGRNFSIISEIQKVLNYPRGGGSSLIGNFSKIFPFFLVMAPLSTVRIIVIIYKGFFEKNKRKFWESVFWHFKFLNQFIRCFMAVICIPEVLTHLLTSMLTYIDMTNVRYHMFYLCKKF